MLVNNIKAYAVVQTVIFFTALHPASPDSLKLPFILLLAVSAIVAWAACHKRYRLVSDTPTSRIASAAQGYVELQGRALPLEGTPTLSPMNGLPCLWYRYTRERRTTDGWRMVNSTCSDDSFMLEDNTGQCLVSPVGASVETRHHEQRIEGEYRHTQWLLLAEQTIYCLGLFSTYSAMQQTPKQEQVITDLLTEWKLDRENLLARFDLDADGEISTQEWEMARLAAAREARTLIRNTIKHASDLHTLNKPQNGAPYLISTRNPDQMLRTYQLWSIGQLALVAVSVAVFILLQGHQ